MFIVVVNLGDPMATTDWSAFGPYLKGSDADEVMEAINDAAAEGLISIDRVIVVPFEAGIANQHDLIINLLRLQQDGGECKSLARSGKPAPDNFIVKAYEQEQAWVKQQIDEDTCEEHNVFCCPLCFKMGAPE
jgi:hypothetical protein